MFRKDRHGLVEFCRRSDPSQAEKLASFFPVSERLRIRKGILREGEDRYAAEDKKKTQCGEIVFYLLSD